VNDRQREVTHVFLKMKLLAASSKPSKLNKNDDILHELNHTLRSFIAPDEQCFLGTFNKHWLFFFSNSNSFDGFWLVDIGHC
jgi:hypothetical protein